jgi:DNA primase
MEPKDEIKQRLDLVDVIQEYISLKPAGTHAFKALCPFHQEKTPSFHISRDKQIWRCFGCNVGGDLFSFVMQMDGVDFSEALRILGKKAGVEIRRFDTREANEKQTLGRLHQFTAAYYHRVLLEASYAAPARAYAKERGLTDELLEKFQIGYSQDAWDAFVKAAKQKGFTEQDLLLGGLALKRRSGTGLIDRFRSRLMIPLRDAHGNTVAFTGRMMRVAENGGTEAGKQEEGEQGPKYLNSPETPLYKKSRLLFGLDLAKQAIRLQNAVMIVEGNLDVVASHKAGVEHVVASSGTALTEEHLDILKRFTNNLHFCFDADAAGFAAAKRGIDLAKSKGFDVAVILIPSGLGKDPDEVVQRNPAEWQRMTQTPVPIMEYYFAHAFRGKNLKEIKDKRSVGAFLLQEIARLRDVIEREHWLEVLGGKLGIKADILRGALQKSGGAEHAQAEAKAPQPREAQKKMREERTEEFLLGIFLESAELRPEMSVQLLPTDFPNGPLRGLYEWCLSMYTQNHTTDTQPSFFAELQDRLLSSGRQEDLKTLTLLAVQGERDLTERTLTEMSAELHRAVAFLKRAAKTRERTLLQSAIHEAERVGDANRARQLLEEMSRV